jgi:5-methyltetrahydrofolate--homocysteine methyltransferase
MTAVSSSVKTVVFDGGEIILGNRINPKTNEAVRDALLSKNFSHIRKEAAGQVKEGANILQVSVELPETDERELMIEVIKKISYLNVPLQIDSKDPKVIEAAARFYNGKPIISAVSGRKESMDAIFPIVKKYGACVIAVTQDKNGLQKSRAERLEIAEQIIETAGTYGIGRERVLIDCLAQIVPLDPDHLQDRE